MNAPTTFRTTVLTAREMHLLDDGQGWFAEGDECYLACDVSNPHKRVNVDLCVNGRTHDNWTTLHDLPASIQERLLAPAV
jgi:hypothetical protein